MKKINKKVAIGLAGGIAAASALIAAIVLLTKRQKSDPSLNNNNYLKLHQKIKDLNNFIIDQKTRQENENILNNPEIQKFSEENQKKLEEVFANVQAFFDKEEKAIIRDIQKIKSQNKKDLLNDKLKAAQNHEERKKVWDEAKKFALKEYPRDFELDKKELNELIKHISDSNKKDEFLRNLSESRDFDDLDDLKAKVEAELLKQGESDYINAKKQSLNAKVDSAKDLSEEEKELLKKLINDSNDLSKIAKTEKEVNDLIAKNKLKNEAIEKIALLNDSELKKELTKRVNDPNSTISDFFDIVSKADDILEGLKDKIQEIINNLKDENNKEVLANKLKESKTQKDLEALLEEAENTEVLEKASEFKESLFLDKKEAESLINQINDENKKNELKNLLDQADNKEKIDEIKKLAKNNIAPETLLDALKQALKDKVDSASLSSQEKDALKKKIDDATNDNFEEVSKEVNDTLLMDIIRDKAKKAIDALSESDLKSSLTHDLNVTNTPKQAYDVLTKAIEKFEKTKKEAQDSINNLKNNSTKELLNKELLEAKTEDQLKNIKAKADAISAIEDQKERIQDLINNLSDSAAKKELNNRLIAASSEDELKEIEKDIKNQEARETVSIPNNLDKQKEYLKNQIDASSIDQKNELKNEIDAANNNDDLEVVANKINEAIKNKALLDATKEALKEKVKNANLSQSDLERLNNLIDNATSENILEAKQKVEEAIKSANLDPTKRLELDKKELEKLISFLNNPDTANNLTEELNEAISKEDLDVLRNKIEEAIKEESLLNAKKAALLNQINNSDLDLAKKEELKQKVNSANSTSEIDKVKLELENAIKDKILKQKAAEAIEKLKDSPKKDELLSVLENSESSAVDYLGIINEVDKVINDLKQKTKDEINNIDDNSKKEELLNELNQATTQPQIEEVLAKAKVQNGGVDVNKVKELINKLSNSNNEKANLLAIVNNDASTDQQIINARNKAKELLNKAKEDALAAVSKAFDAEEHTNLLATANNPDANEDDLIKATNDALKLFNDQKQITKSTLDSFDNNNSRKPELAKALEKAKNVAELKVLDKKIKALEAIAKVKNPDNKNSLLNRLDAINENTENPISVIESIINDAKLQKAIEDGDELEIIKAQTLQLPYPGGSESPAIREIIKKIDEIKNDSSLNNEQKLERANLIRDTFETIKQKINDALTEINKLSPAKQIELISELNNSNLMPEDEFVALMQKINEAKQADKEAAKEEIQNLEKLDQAEKDQFKNSIDNESVNSFDEINAIVDRAKLADKKKDLIEKAKALSYPEGANATAIADIINRINATSGDEAPITMEKAEAFKDVISNIAAEIADIKNKISGFSKTDGYADVNSAFNSADTQDEFDRLKELIASKKTNERAQSNKERIDKLLGNLPYPQADGSDFSGTTQNDSQAINDIKALYANLEGEALNAKLSEVERDLPRIRTSIATAKLQLGNISDDNKTRLTTDNESNINLISKLREANTEEEFSALMDLIAKAKAKDKADAHAKINELNDLSPELKEQFKNRINDSNGIQSIERVLENAELRNKQEGLKKIITSDDYIPTGVQVDGLLEKVNNSIRTINDEILLVTNDNIETKRTELNELKNKINELRDQINALTNENVSEIDQTKGELLSLLGTKYNVAGIEDVKLAIEKAKLKKQVEALEYPSTTSATAINDLKIRIDAISSEAGIQEFANLLVKNELSSEQLSSEDQPTTLPDKIKWFKNKIDTFNVNGGSNVSSEEVEARKRDLNAELDRADTDDEFERLKAHINSAKTQTREEYQAQEKERLKERVRALLYPSRTNATAINEIINEIDQASPDNINALVEKVDNIENKINSSNIEIAKVSEPRRQALNNLLDAANENSEFTNLEAKIQEAKDADKEEIKSQINNLQPLTNKQTFINDLENKSYDQMKAVLTRAKLENLRAAINALPYPNQNAQAKRTLLAETNNLTTDEQIDAKLQEVNNLHQAIQAAISKINSLPYPDQNAQGKNDFKNSLNSKKDINHVNSLVPEGWSEKIALFNRIRTAELNPIPEDSREYGLKRRLNSMDTEREANELAWNLYETKRRRTLSDTIHALPNLSTEEKEGLIATAEVIPDSNKNDPINNLEEKMNRLDEIILEAQKANAKKTVEAISYPNPAQAVETKRILNRKIDNANNLNTINLLIQENNEIDTKMDQLNLEVAQILDRNRVNDINSVLNNVDQMSDFIEAELRINKAKAVQWLGTLTNLTPIQRTTFANKIDAKNNVYEIDLVKQEAERANKKERIKSLIDQIPYPNPTSASAINSIRTLKESVDALDNDIAVDSKEAEINNFISALTDKINTANALPYNRDNSEAETAIINEFNTAISVNDLNRILPNSWTNDLRNYKDIIHSHFSATHPLNDRLDQTYPTRVQTADKNLTVDELKNQIHLTKQATSRTKINALSNLNTTRRNHFIERINAVANALPSDSALNEIDAIVLEATKENYNNFIDNLAYPTDSDLTNNVTSTKQEIRDAFVTPITKNTQLIGRNSLEENLNSIANKINAINTKISQMHNEGARNDYKRDLSNANHTELDDLLTRANRYIDEQTERVNRDRQSATEAIENLPTRNSVRNNLSTRLNNANTSADLETIRNEAITERQRLDEKTNIANSKLNLLPQNNPKRIELAARLANQDQTYEVEHIEAIIREAEEEKALLDSKESVKNLVNTIPYPNLASARGSIDRLKAEVDALTTRQDVEAKRQQIEAFKNAMSTKISEANSLPYPAGSRAEAILGIKNAFNSETTIEGLNRVLPDSWTNELRGYKNSIDTFVDNSSRLYPRLNKTHPTRTRVSDDDNFTVDNLKFQIHETKKVQFIEKINALTNLNEAEKAKYLNKVNGKDANQNGSYSDEGDVQPLANVLPSNESLEAMDREILNATIENYSKFVNNLNYPTDPTLSDKVTKSKNDIIRDLINPITKTTNLRGPGGLEERLNGISNKINEINTLIDQIPSTQAEHNGFKNKLADANHLELDALFEEVNRFVNRQNAEIELNRSAAREAINRLPNGNAVKNNLTTRLSSAQTSEELIRIKNEANEEKTRLDNARSEATNAINALPGNNAKKTELLGKLAQNNETNEVLKLNSIKSAAQTEKQAFDNKKEQAITKLAELPENNTKRIQLTSKLNDTSQTFEIRHIDDIIREAEAEKSLVDLKNTIKQNVDNVPYPNKQQATNAIRTLKEEVDALNDRASLENKQREIESFKNLMASKVRDADALPYISRNAEAIVKIKEAFNGATTANRLNEILPNTWSADLTRYKNIIRNHITNPEGLNARIDATHPTRNDGLSVDNLKHQIHETKKVNVKRAIDQLSSLTQDERNNYKAEIDRLANVLPDESSLNRMNEIFRTAEERNNKKSQAQSAINTLPSNNAVKARLQNELANATNERLVQIKNEAEAEKRRVDELEQKRTEARREIERLPSSNIDRNRLNTQLTNASTKEEIERIKNEANRKLTELNNAKREAINQINTIAYPNSTSNEQRNKTASVNALSNAINNAVNISDIQSLKTENERLKSAVDAANIEIAKLSDNNPTKAALKEELASQTTTNGANNVSRKAREAFANDLNNKKQVARDLINSIRSVAPERNQLIERLNNAQSEEQISKIKNEASLVKRKYDLRDRYKAMFKEDLSENRGGIPPRLDPRRDRATKYNLRDLPSLISSAQNDSELNEIESKIREQENAERNDWNKDYSFRSEFIPHDKSLIKSKLVNKIATNFKYSDVTGNEYTNAFNEKNKLIKEIQSSNNVNDYNTLLAKVIQFNERHEDPRYWERPFISRIRANSNKTLQSAGVFNVNVQKELVDHTIKAIQFAANEEEARRIEEEFIRTFYFESRRVRRLDFEYIGIINNIKSQPRWDNIQREDLEFNLFKFTQTPNISQKEEIVRTLHPDFLRAPNSRDLVSDWRKIAQKEAVEWWVSGIARSGMSIEKKYEWIDKIGIGVYSPSTLKALWNEFINSDKGPGWSSNNGGLGSPNLPSLPRNIIDDRN